MGDSRARPLATPEQVAEYLSTTKGTLAQMRYLGTGPAFVKLGKAVRYRWEDVDAWVEAQRYAQTSTRPIAAAR